MEKILKRTYSIIGIVSFIIFMFVGFYAYLFRETEETVMVYNITRQNYVSTDDPMMASVTLLVTTDKGVMKLQPDGLMASEAFGVIQEGKRYKVVMRGIDFPMTRQYRYIIRAEETE